MGAAAHAAAGRSPPCASSSDLGGSWSRLGLIAFVREQLDPSGAPTGAAIYRVRPDGRSLRRVTRNYVSASAPSWSPDGRRFAFVGSAGGTARLYVANADGSGLRGIAEVLWRRPYGLAGEPPITWSPDSRALAFVTGSPTQRRIETISVAGTGRRVLTAGPADGEPAWSPDGRTIAFASDRDLAAIDLDAGSRRTLVAGCAGICEGTSSGVFATEPSWAPDGRRLAFAYTFEPDPSHVAVTRNDGTRQRLLGFGRRPLWSPDGSRIAYTTFPNERSRAAVAVTRPNGHPRAVTRDRRRRDDVLAAWAPNAKSLLYDSGDYRTGRFEVRVVDVLGRHARRLTRGCSQRRL